MAKQAIKQMYVALGGNNYSAQVESAMLTVDVDPQETTNMASDGYKERVGGLVDGKLDITWKKDTDLSGLDLFLWTNKGALVTFETRLDNGAASATNPKYTGNVLITQHSVGAKVGEAFGGQNSFPTSGVIARATS